MADARQERLTQILLDVDEGLMWICRLGLLRRCNDRPSSPERME